MLVAVGHRSLRSRQRMRPWRRRARTAPAPSGMRS